MASQEILSDPQINMKSDMTASILLVTRLGTDYYVLIWNSEEIK